MQVIVSGRGAGKTHELVEWLKEDPQRVLICHSLTERDRIMRDYGVGSEQLTTPATIALRGSSMLTGRRVAVDNLDLVLPQLIGACPDMVALTGKVVK